MSQQHKLRLLTADLHNLQVDRGAVASELAANAGSLHVATGSTAEVVDRITKQHAEHTMQLPSLNRNSQNMA